MATNFLQRTQELRASWVSALAAAQQARSEVTNRVAPTPTPSSNESISSTKEIPVKPFMTTYSNDLSGDIANAQTNTSTLRTASTIQPVSSTAPLVYDTVPNTQWNNSTIRWWSTNIVAWKTNEQIVSWKTNQVLGEATANYEKNKWLDVTQLEQQKLAAEAAAMETDTELKRFQAEKTALADEENRIQQQKANDDANNLASLQEKERNANEASIAAAKSKADAAERDLSIANDVELQKSNVAFAKLGLTLSTAAVMQAQQIFTTWVYNLSKLKSDNAYKQASLEVEVQKVEFDHTTAINKIINGASEKSYTIRKQLNDDTNKIKNSIIDNRLTRQNNIDKAIDNYQKAIQDNEDDVLNKMQKANTVLSASTKAIYDTLKTKEEYGQDKINTVATNGKWFTMTPSARGAHEKAAWLPTWTVVAQIKSEMSKTIIKELNGIPISSGKLNWIMNEALQLMETGAIPLTQAVQAALLNNKEYSNAIKLANAKKNKVGGRWGWTKSSGKLSFVDTVRAEDWKWYNRYKDPVTWRITQELTTSYDEGGKLTTTPKATDKDEEI